ncbi:efflux transporter outer membrane subunit [Dethiosulfatarculus sandiegensis]|uniref:Multidrug transporter n=1 Tax=Dethiosulfatarculus sandiegensis TaxID=1429043 RepID=A0A0D2JQF8_9BACT|nr:efflux transporter outer membrane subunit [Dethiosulfatarculus sandiegensis]KIX11730.1 multidrug transporter [Dethiosulfatarculus sandiegensis]
MPKKVIILLLGVFVFASGCSLAPEYTRPDSPVPGQWPKGEAYKSEKANAAIPAAHALKWQDFITDQKMHKVIEMALANNRDLRLAALNVEKARAMYGIQQTERLPSLSVTGSGAEQRKAFDLTEPGKPRNVKKYSVDFGVMAWEIDFFGRLTSLADQALEEYLATEEARRSAHALLIAGISKAYFSLAADRDNLKLAQSTLRAQQASYDLIKKSHKNGFATKIDLSRAKTQVESARRDVPRYTQLVAQDLNALNLLAGTTVPEDLLPSGLDSISTPKALSPRLPSEVLLNRPDIIAAEHHLKGANAYIGAARAAFFPRISLTSTVGTASGELSDLFASRNGNWSFVPTISMPIFDARTWAALRVSKAQQKIVLTQYEKAIQTAFKEVADALAVRGTINQQVSAQQSLVAAASETYRLSNKRYTIGIDNYLSVLDAHRALYQQQQILITLKLSELGNRINLYAALGGGAV